MDYKEEYWKMIKGKMKLLSRVHEMCMIPEQYQPKNEQESTYLSLGTLGHPFDFHSNWSTEIQETLDGIIVYYSRQVPYEDYEETGKVRLSWEELQYSDEEVFDMWLRRGQSEYDKQKAEAMEDLERLAEDVGYTLQEKK
jgi:hypothetical protein